MGKGDFQGGRSSGGDEVEGDRDTGAHRQFGYEVACFDLVCDENVSTLVVVW